jgi:hypothetical protein
MSQAHYVLCDYVYQHQPWTAPPAVAHVRKWTGSEVALCGPCLNEMLDWCDGRPKREPRRIEWVYDAGTRICLVHRWPEVLCADWTREEHWASMERLRRRTLEQLNLPRSAAGLDLAHRLT